MKKLLGFFLLFLLSFSCHTKNIITDYQRLFVPVYTAEGQLRIALRVFKMNDVPSFLIVDPQRLTTEVVPITQLKTRRLTSKDKPGYFTFWNLSSTRYYQLLNKTTAPPYKLQNQGITHAAHAVKGNILTIDLCPSSKPFEADFFNKLVNLAEKTKKPTPVTIAISGLWLIGHQDEFQWLIEQEKKQKLAINWANHSFSHVYYGDLPYSENFLRVPTTNMETEILLTEKYLLEAGEIPSVFFRFPGLVSNKLLIKTLKSYGLIPLGTDAWMAYLEDRHETITPGGVILVHGNSNEHEGIVRIMPLLEQLNLLDLREATM